MTTKIETKDPRRPTTHMEKRRLRLRSKSRQHPEFDIWTGEKSNGDSCALVKTGVKKEPGKQQNGN